METAPLTLAHVHARNASHETQRANSSGAREEHELAAAEFASAAGSTKDSEALRMLKLLEEHHRKLAEVVRAHSVQAAAPAPSQHDAIPQQTEAASSPAPATPAVGASRPRMSSPPRAPAGAALARRPPKRDMTSSLTSNLAAARGIPAAQQRRGLPASPEVSAQHAGGSIIHEARSVGRRTPRQLSPEAQKRRTTLKQTKDGPDTQASTARPSTPPKPRPHAPAADEPFQRFYSTFETLFSALSAPLAFAGLPLAEEPAPSSPQKFEKTRARASDGPDVDKLISKAALRAIKEGGDGHFGQESFYVVPTSGGTVSYANILNRQSGTDIDGGGRPDTIPEEDTDEFVDARENLGPPSPSRSSKAARRTSRASSSAAAALGQSATLAAKAGLSPAGKKTREELELENSALKQLLDTQSRRLQMWEASAQSQSLALAQSFRVAAARDEGPAAAMLHMARGEEAGMAGLGHVEGEGDADAGAKGADMDRARELEALLEAERVRREGLERTNEKVTRENEKLLSHLGRYRKNWELLKNGARSRRDKAQGQEGQSQGGAGPQGDGAG